MCANLKFYKTERKVFPDFNMLINQENTMKIIRKLSRHFKFPVPYIKFKYSKQRGLCIKHNLYYIINLPKEFIQIGLLIHELSHLYLFNIYGKSRHSKKLLKIMNKMFKYCKDANYFNLKNEVIQIIVGDEL